MSLEWRYDFICKSQDFIHQTVYDYQLIPFESETSHGSVAEKTSFLNSSLCHFYDSIKVTFEIECPE